MLGGVAAFSLLTIAAVQAGVADVDHRLSMAALTEKAMTTGTVSVLGCLAEQDVLAALSARLRDTGLSDLKVDVEGTRFSVSGAVDDDARKYVGRGPGLVRPFLWHGLRL